MGLTLQFVTGDKKQIVNSIKDSDFDLLEKIEKENDVADFSLHLIPNDLNLLVNAATEIAGLPTFGLREHLDFEENFFDSEDGGACFVDPKIKTLFAKFSDTQAAHISKLWVEKMESEHNEKIGINDDIIDAVKQLISLSKSAVNKNLDVVHVWYL